MQQADDTPSASTLVQNGGQNLAGADQHGQDAVNDISNHDGDISSAHPDVLRDAADLRHPHDRCLDRVEVAEVL